MKETIILLQTLLSKAGYKLEPDGIAGLNTIKAAQSFLVKREPTALDYDKKRQLIATLQILANDLNVTDERLIIDGYNGPSTDYVLELASRRIQGRPAPKIWRSERDEIYFKNTENPHGFPLADQSSMMEYYGEPGDPACHSLIDLPYPLRIAWNPQQQTQKMLVNKKLENIIWPVLNEVLEDYGREQVELLGLDLFGGCFNYRKKRGGSTLSTHAFAAAFDFDPLRNQLRWNSSKAQFAKPVYKKWWGVWEKHGFISLGREMNYDFMHIQATA